MQKQKYKKVAVLFARADSNYKKLPECDVWDRDRDATKYNGSLPVIAHPPCRAWGQLRTFAKPEPGEKELAIFAIEQIRKNGGILEHPKNSTLWTVAHLPKPGSKDIFGGWTLPINQFWFGHRAEKATFLYIVGTEPKNIPDFPILLDEPTHVVQSRKRTNYKPHITKSEREHTPINLAIWLCKLAEKCKLND